MSVASLLGKDKAVILVLIKEEVGAVLFQENENFKP